MTVFERNKFRFLRRVKYSKGVSLIETVFTLPVLCYLIFFVLELMKINVAQTAIEAISAEATFDFIANGTIENFDSIIEKHRPKFVPRVNIRYWLRLYKNLEEMCSQFPYGGGEIAYPRVEEDTSAAAHVGIQELATMDFIDPNGDGSVLLAAQSSVINQETASDYINNGTPSGTAFVLTFVCGYIFSSSLVKVLFSDGSNTINVGTKAKGSTYLLWGRGSGIVD